MALEVARRQGPGEDHGLGYSLVQCPCLPPLKHALGMASAAPCYFALSVLGAPSTTAKRSVLNLASFFFVSLVPPFVIYLYF